MKADEAPYLTAEEAAQDVIDCLLHLVDELTNSNGPIGYSGSLLDHTVRHSLIKEALDSVIEAQKKPTTEV